MASQGRLWVDPIELTRKGRGAYFTPTPVAEFLAGWAIDRPGLTVLEPSCGEASFLIAAARRQADLAAHTTGSAPGELNGLEIHPESARAALALVNGIGRQARIEEANFFEVLPEVKYDVVLGNPPYIRYQSFAGSDRESGLRAALAAGVNLSGLSSSWAAFLVHASRFLHNDGKLGFVLPAELLTVKYAAPVRTFLLKRFARLRLIVFEELVFPDALEDVVLLMAEGSGGCDHFEVHQVKNAEHLRDPALSGWARVEPAAKWSHALVEQYTWQQFQHICKSPMIERLGDWGEAFLGAVTGNNDYFALSDADVARLKLSERDLRRISPPGSRHLRGFEFTDAAWLALRREGKRCWLFYPRATGRSGGAAEYIEAGHRAGVANAYKCTTRTPWFSTPLTSVPDLFLTYMDAERPRLTTNLARVYPLNSVYGVRLRHGRKELGRSYLPVAALNTVTLLGAEVVGRAYGGGMLKLEPREAEEMPVPSLGLIESVQAELRAVKPQLAPAIRQGDLMRAVEIVDRVLLLKTGVVNTKTLDQLRRARDFLYQRRMNRGKSNGRQH